MTQSLQPQKDIDAIAAQRQNAFILTLRHYADKLGVEELSRRTGITPVMIHQYISGRNTQPTLKTLIRLSEGLNLTLAEILDE